MSRNCLSPSWATPARGEPAACSALIATAFSSGPGLSIPKPLPVSPVLARWLAAWGRAITAATGAPAWILSPPASLGPAERPTKR